MMGEKNGHNPGAPQNLSQAHHSNFAEDIQSMIGPAIHQTVNQYHGLLRQGLEQEVQRIIQEFEAATSDIENTIAKRVRARLGELVQQEVRRIFDTALSNVEGSFGDPFLGLERGVRSESDTPRRPRPQQRNPIFPGSSTREPETFDNDQDDWGRGRDGGSHVTASPTRPQTPPSLWVMPNLDDQVEERPRAEAVAPAARPQPTQDPNLFQNWDDQEVEIDEQDDPEPEPQPQAQAPASEDEIYEGTVRLNVEANGCIREVVHFVRELRQAPQLRLLRMVGNNKEGVEIWLGLREPLRLRKMLPQIAGISIISTPVVGGQSDKERRLLVRLVPNKSRGESQEYPWLEDAEAKKDQVTA